MFKKKEKIPKHARIVCLVMCVIMIIGIMPAYAVDTTSKYDFSSVDEIDKYDQYEKKVSDGEVLDSGIEYVPGGLHNEIKSTNAQPFDYFRYGAFVRSADEIHHYRFFNFEYSGDGVIPQNVLTIYADREVTFEVINNSQQVIVNNYGVQVPSAVNYYNKTLDNGHYVYYIELKPAQAGQSTNMISFGTDSTSVQPHYSFWFGCPLAETKTVTGNSFAISTKYPNTSSSIVSVNAPYSIPSERAWVDTVTVKKLSESGKSNIMSTDMKITFPGYSPSTSKRIDSSMEFEALPSFMKAGLARGTYKFQLVNTRWGSSGLSSNYMFQGQMSIKYIYAFGAE